MVREYQNGHAQQATDTIQTARALVQAVDAQIGQGKLLAEKLAGSDALAHRDFAAFHERALRLVNETSFVQSVYILDRNGTPMVNTRVPLGQALHRQTNPQQILNVVASGKAAKPEVIVNPLTHLPVISLAVPVHFGANVEFVLAMEIAPDVIRKILTAQNLSPNWVTAILDESGTIVARTHAPEKFIGEKALPEIRRQLAIAAEGSYEGPTQEGIQTEASFSRSAQTGWSVVIGIPRNALEAKLRQSILLFAIGATLMLGISMCVARLFGKRIATSILALRALARSLGNRSRLVMPQLQVREAQEVAQAMDSAAQTLAEQDDSLAASHELLVSREAELTEAQRQAHIGSWTWNVKTDEIVASKPLLEMLGLDVFPPFSEQGRVVYPIEAWRHLNAAVQDTIETGASFDLELPALHADGTSLWVKTRGVAVRDDDGQITLLRVTVQDITEPKLIEVELNQHRMHLEQLVRSRTSELQVAKDAAQAANSAKSRFLAAASHDLRQPLAALSLYTGMLNSAQFASESKIVGKMQSCVDSLNELLTELLDLSKLEAGVVVPCICDFPITDLFDRLASTYAPAAEAKGIRLRIRRSTLVARTDPVLFLRILSNLMDNAIRYTEHGGLLVTCRRRRGKDWVEVWDSGIGIPSEHQAEIFEAFKQLGDGACNKGSGLGLAIVDKTAVLLGLEYGVRSRLGRGSVFSIELPPGTLNGTNVKVPEPPPSRTLRIALVEDNAMVLEALTITLRSLGHQVLAVSNLEALLAELDNFQPHVVLSDYRLADGETGLDVVTGVRNRLGADFPMIIMTGDTAPVPLRRMADGGVVVLHKPLDLKALQTCLQELTV